MNANKQKTGQTRISHFTLKLMDIDSEHLGIPDTDYKVVIQMPSDEFQRICRYSIFVFVCFFLFVSRQNNKK